MEKEQMFKRLIASVEALESATDARSKYKAESQICRLAGKLGIQGSILYGKSGAYIPAMVHVKGSRTPLLIKVLGQEDLDKMARKQNVSGLNGRIFLSFEPTHSVKRDDDYVDFALVERGKDGNRVQLPSGGYTGVLDKNEGRLFGVLPEDK